MAVRILLVDDHDLIRQGLRRAFERDQDFEVVGEAATSADARHLTETLTPHVVVTDVRLPDGTGLDLAKALRDTHPALGIVVLTMYGGDETLLAALESGASAFVSKEAPSSDVVSAARHAAVSPRSFTAKDLPGAMYRRRHPTGPTLSERERDVLELLAEGYGVAAIARRLYVSQSTAKTHIAKIYEKLGASNRAQAIMCAIRAGLLAGEKSDSSQTRHA